MRDGRGVQGIPGRSLDLGEGGIAAILAGTVSPGDSVAVEFLLPEMGLGLHAKAVVRHHADLRCGLEFFGLSLEQQAMIRRWTRRMLEKPAKAFAPRSPISTLGLDLGLPPDPVAAVSSPKLMPEGLRHRDKWVVRMLAVVALASMAGALVAWRYWHMQWVELQQQAEVVAANAERRVQLPPGAIDLLTVYKVDAVTPPGGTGKDQVVLLRIVVASDGTVIDTRPENGEEAFNRAAMDAVKEWRFQPYRVNGAPAQVETTVAVQFH